MCPKESVDFLEKKPAFLASSISADFTIIPITIQMAELKGRTPTISPEWRP
jgi:hypothetical protein